MSKSDRVATAKLSPMLCCYINTTNKIQLIRVIKDRCLSLEKVIFPQQRILFEAMPKAQLEIHNSSSKKLKIAQIIPCEDLKIN